jgi:hypothetical protein
MTLPCQKTLYRHQLLGGRFDGMEVVSEHRYGTLEVGNTPYRDRGDEPVSCDAGGWEVFGDLDKGYVEYAFRLVTLVPA